MHAVRQDGWFGLPGTEHSVTPSIGLRGTDRQVPLQAKQTGAVLSFVGKLDSATEIIVITTKSYMALVGVIVVLSLLAGCSKPIPNRDPIGEDFPSVVGESLEEQRVELPEDLEGAPAVLLIGYAQEAQFEIDRWLMGFLQLELGARILELPTIPDLVPTFASGWIDDGMRSGIPKEDWGVVVTLYGNAAKPLAELTGTTEGRRARIIVLDATGKVAWFDDAGDSVRKAMAVASLLDARNSK